MKRKTLRDYVWVFCIYFGFTIQWISRRNVPLRPPHLERSLLTFFPMVFVPALLAIMFLSMFGTTQNRIERLVLVFSALSFALDAVNALHQFEYMSYSVPHSLPSWSFFVATVLLGYRTNQLLKEHDKEIGSIECSTPS